MDAETTMLIYYKHGVMNPRLLSHLLGLGMPAPTCAGGFILFGLDKAGDLTVLDHKREALWACSNHQCPDGGGRDDPVQDGAGTCSCLTI